MATLLIPKRQANKSMDVRAKQRPCYECRSLNSELRGGGFAPRHLSRSTASLDIQAFGKLRL